MSRRYPRLRLEVLAAATAAISAVISGKIALIFQKVAFKIKS
jgi:hypothetical protein